MEAAATQTKEHDNSMILWMLSTKMYIYVHIYTYIWYDQLIWKMVEHFRVNFLQKRNVRKEILSCWIYLSWFKIIN